MENQTPVLTAELLREESANNPQIDAEAKRKYKEFADRFNYFKLENLSDDELLPYVFRGINKTNLCDTLEFGKLCEDFGNIYLQGGVKAYGLYNKDGKWCASYGDMKQSPLDDQKNGPIVVGRAIVNDLANGARLIEKWSDFDTEEGYRKLYVRLYEVTHGMIRQMWFKKYYHMLFPELFSTFYTEKYSRDVLESLGLSTDGDFYTQLGRIACYIKDCGISSCMLGYIFWIKVDKPRRENKKNELVESQNSDDAESENTEKFTKDVPNTIKYPRNRIFFGAPGTGKSYLLNRQQKEYFDEGNVERVTFHSDYSYANFVGAYKPVTETKTAATVADTEVRAVVDVLTDKNLSGQGKYDALFEKFKMGDGLTRLPLLLSLYSVDDFRTKKWDGSYTANNNDVEINHGKALQKYVRPYFGADGETSSEIEYRYVPGPFMRVYTEAVRHPGENYLLIIEEINRANVAAVFGDVFQLLDRAEEGESEYPIQASEDIRNYLARELGGTQKDYVKISIPANMYIWATMNSADQGVFPMDTAFKRRWDFEYIGIDDSEDGIEGKYVQLAHGSQKVEWNKLRKAINDYLAENKINEDKQLGPYFIAKDIVAPRGNEIDAERFATTFKNKVIMYLYEDAARQKRDDLFDGCDGKRYSEICKEFDDKGYDIFNQSIVDKVS